MRKILLVAIMAICIGFIPTTSHAQTAITDTRALVWGASPFQDSLWAIDTATLQVVYRLAPSLPSFTITGCTGLATDPTTGITYVIMKVSAVSGRVLGTIDLMTGVCTQIGNLGDNFSTISFREDGQLFGVTGDGASVPETLYLIDKATGAKTVAAALGAGADGEVICYNRANDLFYHWSGNGTVVFESVLSVAPYTVTNIPTSGAANGETFGAMYINPTTFWRSNISSAFNRQTIGGVYSTGFASTPDDLRGLVILPYFTANDDTVCQNETFSLTGGGHMLYDNFIYHWGDGDSDTLLISNGVLTNGTHMYAAAGNYTVQVETDNGSGGDTIYSFQLRVNAIPIVTITGFSTVCSGDSVTLTGSSGGTSQWYMNGVLIPGATTNVYSTNTAGVYNMIKTNLDGCSDSAAVGTTVVVNTYPVVALGNDTTACDMLTVDAGNVGSSYSWSTGDTTQMVMTMMSATLSVTVTNIDGCSSDDSINVTINPLPTVNLGPDQSDCAAVTVDAGNPGATYLWCNGATTQTVVLTSSGTCAVMVTDTNGCTSSDTINVTIFGNPTVTLTAMLDSMCSNIPPVPLIGSPMGGTFSGPGTSPNTFTPSVAGAGVHTVLYAYTDGNGCTSSDSVIMTVFANPTVTASANPATVCADDADVTLSGSPAGGSFTGASVTGNNFDPSIGAGTYPIIYTFTDVNGCSGIANTSVQVNACVGIEEAAAVEFTIFPNPSTGIVNLNLPAGDATVEVMDVLGNVISAKQFSNAGIVQLDLSSQANGVYFVRVNGTNAQRVIIQK